MLSGTENTGLYKYIAWREEEHRQEMASGGRMTSRGGEVEGQEQMIVRHQC